MYIEKNKYLVKKTRLCICNYYIVKTMIRKIMFDLKKSLIF